MSECVPGVHAHQMLRMSRRPLGCTVYLLLCMCVHRESNEHRSHLALVSVLGSTGVIDAAS